jgi:ubiquinone/menaquinone biosynthesis C-methylase UbiE
MAYNAEAVAQYFDTLAEGEWLRLESTLQGRIKYAVHRHFIAKYVHPTMHVLDVGSGPGRFALDLVELGADVTLVDISPVQLDLARSRLAAREATGQVRAFHRLDVLDLTSLAPDSYDAVVCFGGAVSYTRERYLDALRQLVRVARPGAPILLSVMSLFGVMRLLGPLDAAAMLETTNDHLDFSAVLSADSVICTRPTSTEFHQPMALFTSTGLRAALVEVGLEVQVLATANPFLPEFLAVPKITASERAAQTLVDLEVALCEQPGLVDAGGHLLVVARKRAETVRGFSARCSARPGRAPSRASWPRR